MLPCLPPGCLAAGTELPRAVTSTCYPVKLELRYEVVHADSVIQGVGRSRQLGNTHIVFTSDRRLRNGTELDLSLDWPSWLPVRPPLELSISGHVVLSQHREITVEITSHAFRTGEGGVFEIPVCADRRQVQHEVNVDSPTSVRLVSIRHAVRRAASIWSIDDPLPSVAEFFLTLRNCWIRRSRPMRWRV